MATKALALSSLADGQVCLREHLQAHLLVAKVQLAFKSPDRALRGLDSVWADVLGTNRAPLIGEAKIVRADALLACVDQAIAEELDLSDERDQAIQEAVVLLEESRIAYGSVGHLEGTAAALSALAKVYHRSGDITKRDEAAALWQATTTSSSEGEEKEMLNSWILVERSSAISSVRIGIL